ncbi:LytR/AlgR family response regulator transcription factor [Enterococcus sp. AZ109]|uniref:LytR/AlgR family response regulator transcription factor n=1 Tax=Enterococcus sp. AZ109 TaxID=2774634 RepID=UPI003F203F2D
MLRVGICDDEQGVREALSLMLTVLSDREEMALKIYEFSSGEGVVKWLMNHPGELDLLFLDIDMRGMDGITTGKEIRKTDMGLSIAYLTGHPEQVFQGYAVGALDYLIKPLEKDKLREVLKRAMVALQLTEKDTYTVRNAEGLYRIPKREIRYVYSDRRLVTVETNRRSYTFYGKLGEVEQDLGNGFVRIHKRYLVRAQAVDQVESGQVKLGEVTLPISRTHRQAAMQGFARTLLNKEAGR